MVALTAVVLVLPLALAAPGGANDVNHLRGVIEDALRAGLPGSPDWVFDIPLVGPTLGDLWNRWAADITVMVEALRPYFGIVLEGGLEPAAGPRQRRAAVRARAVHRVLLLPVWRADRRAAARHPDADRRRAGATG